MPIEPVDKSKHRKIKGPWQLKIWMERNHQIVGRVIIEEGFKDKNDCISRAKQRLKMGFRRSKPGLYMRFVAIDTEDGNKEHPITFQELRKSDSL